jgi:hypothetical protein
MAKRKNIELEKIIYKGNVIYITPEEQTAPSGRKFKLRSITSIGEGKFIQNAYRYYWIIMFTYLDNGDKFGFEVDYFNQVIKKI